MTFASLIGRNIAARAASASGWFSQSGSAVWRGCGAVRGSPRANLTNSRPRAKIGPPWGSISTGLAAFSSHFCKAERGDGVSGAQVPLASFAFFFLFRPALRRGSPERGRRPVRALCARTKPDCTRASFPCPIPILREWLVVPPIRRRVRAGLVCLYLPPFFLAFLAGVFFSWMFAWARSFSR